MSSDKQQFIARLVSEQRTPLERYLARKLDSPEDAAEVAQEAFLRLHRLDQPQELDNARAFLFQVATNLAVDHLRRRTLYFRFLNAEKSLVDENEPPDPNAEGISPEEVIAAREKLQAIYRAVDGLPFKVKQAFLLHRRSGLPYGQIARELNVSVSSVEKYVLQALRHCRQELDRYYRDGETGEK